MDRSNAETSSESAEAPERGGARPELANLTTDGLSPRMATIAAALIARSNGKYDAVYLRRLVADLAAVFDGAPVQDYVVVLVTKQATDELRRLDALRPMAA